MYEMLILSPARATNAKKAAPERTKMEPRRFRDFLERRELRSLVRRDVVFMM
jgi:hypothetical protein